MGATGSEVQGCVVRTMDKRLDVMFKKIRGNRYE
jgi:hypothetical protein